MNRKTKKQGSRPCRQIHFRAPQNFKTSDQETQGAPESLKAAPEFCWWMTTGRAQGLLACLSGRANLLVVAEAAEGLERSKKSATLARSRLMDVEMPKMDGLAATQPFAENFRIPRSDCVHAQQSGYIVQAIQMGARGFALKTSPSEN